MCTICASPVPLRDALPHPACDHGDQRDKHNARNHYDRVYCTLLDVCVREPVRVPVLDDCVREPIQEYDTHAYDTRATCTRMQRVQCKQCVVRHTRTTHPALWDTSGDPGLGFCVCVCVYAAEGGQGQREDSRRRDICKGRAERTHRYTNTKHFYSGFSPSFVPRHRPFCGLAS